MRWHGPVLMVAVLLAGATGAAASSSTAVTSAPRAPAIRIAPAAQCHGARCFVTVTFTDVAAGRAAISAGPSTRRVRVIAGTSRRVVEFRRAALTQPVVVQLGALTRQRVLQRTALPVNRPLAQCATVDAVDLYLSVGPPNEQDAATNLAGVGTRTAAVLFVDFPDATGTGDPRPATATWMAAGIDHMTASSYGRFDMDILDTTDGWVRMPRPVADYGFADGVTYAEHQVYIQDAIDVADSQIDFAPVELIILVASPAAGLVGSQAFRGLADALVTDEGTRRPAVTFGSDAIDVAGIVFPHEVGHTLGMPDLYAFSGDVHQYVGKWDYMGNIFEPPTDLFAWQRTKLGWLDAPQTLCARDQGATDVRLTPLGATGGVKAVFVRTGATTGLVVENRQAVGNDAAICDAGALVYTMDSAVATGTGPIRVAGGDPTGVGCGIGPRSDAPLGVGETVLVDGVTVTVLGTVRGVIEVRVAR